VRQRGIRRATGLILLLGIAVVAFILLSPERRLERRVADLELRDESARVRRLLGEPEATCTGGEFGHLRRRFPTGTPPTAVEGAIGRLEQETSERWIYRLDDDARVGCAPGEGTVEVGLDGRHRVLWYVPAAGRVPIVVPEGYLPAATDDE
jgi:HAMP domain-containing protein